MTHNIDWRMDDVKTIIQELKAKPGALLPVLHAIQHYIGYLPDSVVPIIAQEMLLTRAEVHGVISFYHHFHSHKTGKHIVEICRAEACQAVGSRQLEKHAKTSLGIDFAETTPCDNVTLEPVYCLGNCATGPSVRINDTIHGRVTEARFDELMSDCCETMQEAI